MDCDDRQLLARFYRDGDDEAFTTFIARHRDWALRKAKNYFAADAEDIVQVSILRMMDCVPEGGDIRNPLGWWSTIIGSVAVDHIRRSVRRHARENTNAEEAQQSLDMLDPSQEVSRVRILAFVYEEIRQLEDNFRGPLIRRFFEDLSYNEIAAALECSPGTVGSRLSRAIAQIRDGLKAKGRFEIEN